MSILESMKNLGTKIKAVANRCWSWFTELFNVWNLTYAVSTAWFGFMWYLIYTGMMTMGPVWLALIVSWAFAGPILACAFAFTTVLRSVWLTLTRASSFDDFMTKIVSVMEGVSDSMRENGIVLNKE